MPDYEAALTGSVRGMRIAVCETYFLDGADAPVIAAFEAALATLRVRRRRDHPRRGAEPAGDRRLYRACQPGGGRGYPRQLDARAPGRLCDPPERPAVRRLCHPRASLCRGAVAARSAAAAIRGGDADRLRPGGDADVCAPGCRPWRRPTSTPTRRTGGASWRSRPIRGRSTISACRRSACPAASMTAACRSACNWPAALRGSDRAMAADAFQQVTDWHRKVPVL